MEKELRNRMIEDLQKSGFASEMAAMKIFWESGWSCQGAPAFFDRDEKTSRTTDLLARLSLEHDISKSKGRSQILNSSITAVCEVKKSATPWVLFRQPVDEIHVMLNDGWANLIAKVNPTIPGPPMVSILAQEGLLMKCMWQGYHLHQSFKPPDQPTRWFSAMVTVCKAAEDALTSSIAYIPEKDDLAGERPLRPASGLSSLFDFIKPLVVLDGDLVAADIGKDGVPSLTEIGFAPFSFEYRSSAYTRGRYNVDIVRLTELPEYIAMLTRRLHTIFEAQCDSIGMKWADIEPSTNSSDRIAHPRRDSKRSR